jgi:hypothetical protein
MTHIEAFDTMAIAIDTANQKGSYTLEQSAHLYQAILVLKKYLSASITAVKKEDNGNNQDTRTANAD